MTTSALTRGEGCAIAAVGYSEAVLYNGLGQYGPAVEAAQKATATDDIVTSSWALHELVEAAARSGRPELARDAADRLSERAVASGTPWAMGAAARSRALVADGEAAEELYREAIDRLEPSRMAWYLARARLSYGEWLRRENRRVDARGQLREAYDMFASMGSEGFADRARGELLATGENVRKRRDDTRDELTPQEEQIARLARDGRTNAEIGAQLFLSPRTVEWHLRKVFAKLAISSRLGLRDALPSRDPETETVLDQGARPVTPRARSAPVGATVIRPRTTGGSRCAPTSHPAACFRTTSCPITRTPPEGSASCRATTP